LVHEATEKVAAPDHVVTPLSRRHIASAQLPQQLKRLQEFSKQQHDEIKPSRDGDQRNGANENKLGISKQRYTHKSPQILRRKYRTQRMQIEITCSWARRKLPAYGHTANEIEC
jgi:hypothetical protein